MKKVAIPQVAHELIGMPENYSAYYDKITGKVIYTQLDSMLAAEGGEDDGLHEFDGLYLENAKVFMKNGQRYLLLPDKFEILEHNMMESFCYSVEDPILRNNLIDTIKTRNAHHHFKDTTLRFGLLKAWQEYRKQEYEKIVQRWCENNGIEYEGIKTACEVGNQ